jgi:glycosyltransferase involved in cell wall biosynthesis
VTVRRDGRPLRVVTMIDTLAELGGAETLAVEMAIRLDPTRFERVLCVTRWSGRMEIEEPARSVLARLRSSGVRILGVRRRSRLMVWPWMKLLRFLRRERVDIVHAHKFGSNVWAVIFGRLSRVPVIVSHEHMWSFEGGRARHIVDRDLIARFSDALIAVSERTRREMIETEGIRPDDVIFIPNGIPDLPPGDGARARAGLELGADDLVVGTVALLRPEKALEVLVRATALLAPAWPNLRLVIVGDGAERARLERLVAELGVSEIVRMPGYRADVPDLLAAMDLAVCCSDYEGGPLSVLEYMDAGLPVVATRVGGLPGLIEDGESGVLVEPRDPQGLADAISSLLADPDRRRELGDRAREERRKRFGIDGWVARIEQLYATLLPATSRHSAEYRSAISSRS